MKEYHFQITLVGEGNTPEEAWEDICKYVGNGGKSSLGEFDKNDIIKIMEQEPT